MLKHLTVVVCLAAVALSISALAQETPQVPPGFSVITGDKVEGGVPTFLRPETPDQRLARLGTAEDPGPNPDPNKIWYRFGQAYQIHSYKRDWAIYEGGQDQHFIRPFGPVNAYRELYQHNDLYVWIWQPVNVGGTPAVEAEDPRMSTQGNRRWAEEDVQFFQYIRSEFTPLKPADAGLVVRFSESSNGLPQGGSWRNSLAVADMNGDGFLDLIAPPERAGGFAPSIFLGDGKGNWTFWPRTWPHPTDYGSVAAADFNKDGHMDLAFGVHLQGVYVYLGNGKGEFSEVTEGLPRNFGTRRVVVTDADRDGYPDLAAISEGPTAMYEARGPEQFRLRLYLNRNKGQKWEMLPVSEGSHRVAGDWLSVGDFNNDRIPDFAASTIWQGSVDTLYVSEGPRKWRRVDPGDGKIVPFVSFYVASTTGRFSSKNRDDAIVSYSRIWPPEINPKLIPKPEASNIVGLDRIQFTAKGAVRTPIVRWAGQYAITGVASADFNGDGHLDIISTRSVSSEQREATLLLGDGKGNFKTAALEGLQLRPHAAYDLKVADVNGDKRPDVIVMYETNGATALSPRDGSINVFLNQGAVRPTVTAAK